MTIEKAKAMIASNVFFPDAGGQADAIDQLLLRHALVAESEFGYAALSSHQLRRDVGVEWLTIPTSGNAQMVERAVRSFSKNMEHFGRKCSVLISDDSHDERRRSSCRQRVVALASETGCSLFYAGIEEKRAFAQHLLRDSDIPPEVVDFALFGSSASSCKTGANRNAILLQTVGSKVLSVDDDTVCDPRVAPESSGDVVFTGHSATSAIWCFRDSVTALDFGVPAIVDVIGRHEECLGRGIGQLLLEIPFEERLVSAEGMCDHLLSSLFSGKGTICATYHGSRGDSGCNSDFGLITNRAAAIRERIGSLGPEYDVCVSSRQIARQSLRTAIAHAECGSLSMGMGLDNASPLPPFMPIGRNQDGVFSALLGRVSDHQYVAHLPFTLAHIPYEPRSYAANRDSGVRLSDIVSHCLSTWNPNPGSHALLERTMQVGRYLREIGSLPAGEFDGLINILMCTRVAHMIGAVDAILLAPGDLSPEWADDLERRRRVLRHAPDDPDFFVPTDVDAASGEERRRATQQLVASFGDVATWWPAIVERTLQLREEGITLGKDVTETAP
jgi:hypothetical protein